jgi:hypothetical protein
VIRRNHDAALALGVAVIFFAGLALIRHDAARLRPYMQVVAVLVALTVWADRTATFSRPMVWALTSLAILHLVGGLMTPLGNAPTCNEKWHHQGWLKFDQVVHAYGSAVLTVACAHIVIGALGDNVRRGAGLALVAALMACGLGALNELVEFLFGLSNTHLHAGGLENTGWDLAFNLAGAVIGGVLVSTHDRRDDDRASRREDARLRGLRTG